MWAVVSWPAKMNICRQLTKCGRGKGWAYTNAFPITSDFGSNGVSRVEPLSRPELLTNDSEYVLVNSLAR